MNQQGSFMKNMKGYFTPFTILYKKASVPLKISKNEQKTRVTTFPRSLELVFYLTTIIHFISITPNSSHGAVINYLKEPLFFLNSLSSGPEAILVLPFLVPFLTAAMGSGSSLSLTFLLIFREVIYLLKDDLWKPSEQSWKCKNHRMSSFICKIYFQRQMLLARGCYLSMANIVVCFLSNVNLSPA